MTWQNNFRNYTTGTAFLLSLTRDQVSLLAYLHHGYEPNEWQSSSGRHTFIPTINKLQRKGLAEHNPAARVVGFSTPGVRLRWIYRVTPAGEKVLELLRLAGLLEESEVSETEQNFDT